MKKPDISNNGLPPNRSGRRGVVGGPGLVTQSPFIHAALGDGDYGAYRIAPEELGAFVAEKRLAAYNVTIPHKVKIMEFLDEISPEALEIGAVNTVITDKNGKTIGKNTDVDGFREALAFHGISVKNKKVCVLGSGGASRAVKNALEKEKAGEIVTVSRRGKVTYADTGAYADADVLVNCTPVGAGRGNAESPVNLDLFFRLGGVYDLIYNPDPTRLVYEAANRGIPAWGGLYMLLAQAAHARRLFGERPPEKGAIENLYQKMSRGGAVFIGMPGSGKTKAAQTVANLTGSQYADTDEMIEKETGMKIPEIFEKHGEAYFRNIEKAVIKRLAETLSPPAVIAVGGGAVLDECNRYYLKSLGRVYWVIRDIEALDTAGRPLSKDLEKLAAKRYPLYESLCDEKIINDGKTAEAFGIFAPKEEKEKEKETK